MSILSEEQSKGTVLVKIEVLREFAESCFLKIGIYPDHASIAAGVLVESDLRGIESHGVVRLKDHYIDRISNGGTNPKPKIRILHEAQSTALMDGDAGVGLVVGYRAMELAIQKAGVTGAGFVSVTNSRHFGIAGYYPTMAISHDMIGIAMTNASPLVVPTFGSVPMLGTNPISIAAPVDDGPPFILDMATSVVSAGKLEMAIRNGEEIPEGWAMDLSGSSTTDPKIARTSQRFLPLGSHPENSNYKGYGLGIVVDILCGVLSGIGASPGLGKNFGHFFGALRIDSFRPAKEFKQMMTEMGKDLRATPTVPGYGPVIVPGDKEQMVKEERLINGVPLKPEVVESLLFLGQELGVQLRI
jgi:LDH2 family malate/lactate/ureidoglycolate dehydrogenase